MTIAKAINDIAAAQGGTPARPATIAGAIDALNDALAGSDQQAARTIEDAVVLLGEHIGGGGGDSDYFTVNLNIGDGTLDKTWNEISAAVTDGKIVLLKIEYGDEVYIGQLTDIDNEGGTYNVYFSMAGQENETEASSATADGVLVAQP